jgi:hypothetical protein
MSGGYNGHRGWGGGVNRGRGPQAPNLAFQLARQLDAFTQQQGHVQLKGRGEPKLAVPVVRVLLGEREGPGGNRKERELEDQAKARSILKVVSKFKDCFSGGKPCQLGEEGAAVQISYISTSTQARELGEAWVNKGFEAQGVKYTAMYDLGTRAPGTRKVVVTGLPPNYAMEGVIEVLLQASGYATGPSMVVETFLGAMSIGGVPQELPRFDIIVSFVRAPPEDPMLRQLPTGFKTLDGQQVWVQVEGKNLGEEFGFEPDPWQVGEAEVWGAGGGCGAHPLGPMPTPPPPPPHTQQQQQQQQQPLPPPGQPNRAGQGAVPWHGVQFGSGVRRAAWQQQQQQPPPPARGVGPQAPAGQGGALGQDMQGGGRMEVGTPTGMPGVTAAAAAAGGSWPSMAPGVLAQGRGGGLPYTPSAAAGASARAASGEGAAPGRTLNLQWGSYYAPLSGPSFMDVDPSGRFQYWRHNSNMVPALISALDEVPIENGEQGLTDVLWAFVQDHQDKGGLHEGSPLWHISTDYLPEFASNWVKKLQQTLAREGSEGEREEAGEGPSGDPCSSSGAGGGAQTAAGADSPTAPDSSPASEAGSEHSRGRSRSRRQRRGGRGGGGRGGGRGGGGTGPAPRDAQGVRVEGEGSPAAAGAGVQGGGRGAQAGPSSPRQRTRSSSRVRRSPVQYWLGNSGTAPAPSSPQGSRGRRT